MLCAGCVWRGESLLGIGDYYADMTYATVLGWSLFLLVGALFPFTRWLWRQPVYIGRG